MSKFKISIHDHVFKRNGRSSKRLLLIQIDSVSSCTVPEEMHCIIFDNCYFVFADSALCEFPFYSGSACLIIILHHNVHVGFIDVEGRAWQQLHAFFTEISSSHGL